MDLRRNSAYWAPESWKVAGSDSSPGCVLVQAAPPEYPLERHGKVLAALAILCRKSTGKETVTEAQGKN